MKPKVYGVTHASASYEPNYLMRIKLELAADPGFDVMPLLKSSDWGDLFPGNVIVKCQHCGQWAARKADCHKCGAPVD